MEDKIEINIPEDNKEIKNEIILEEKSSNQIIKVLFLGKQGAGKTSIKSIIFNNMQPHETFNLASTKEIEETHIHFINNVLLEILDCTSDESEIKNYISTKKELIFSNIGILIYVLNAKDTKEDEIKLFEE